MDDKITARDEQLIREWLNCEEASVSDDGGVWVQGPMTGHWLRDDRLDAFMAWRAEWMAARAIVTDPNLKRAGEALYGDRWQSALARDLGVGDRRVREWVAGDRRIPPGVWADIAALLRDRRDAIDTILRDLD